MEWNYSCLNKTDFYILKKYYKKLKNITLYSSRFQFTRLDFRKAFQGYFATTHAAIQSISTLVNSFEWSIRFRKLIKKHKSELRID